MLRQDKLGPTNPNKKRKRVGRGIASGFGKTAGRGTKGQKSRTGYNLPTGFEGGQTPLKMRLPKQKGFHRVKKISQIINLIRINDNFKAGETVSPKTLLTKKLIKTDLGSIKILGEGEIDKALTFKNLTFSKKALEKISKSKGKILK